jgi:glycosyltransferase involved in cell wall biosynthesis
MTSEIGLVPPRLRVGFGSAHDRVTVHRKKDALVHLSYYRSSWSWAAPTVVTVYDLISLKYPNLTVPDRQSAYLLDNVRRASAVIAISEHTRSDLLEIPGISPEKVRTVLCGVTQPSPDEATTKPPKSAGYLLFVGPRGGYKNWANLLRALELPELQEVELLCFGGGPPTQAELDLLSKHRLRSTRVTFAVGDDLTLGAAYRNAAALVYPSLYEGFGLPVLEAMIRSCPVVASRSASIPEVAGSAAELVDAQDPGALAHGILRSLDSFRRSELIQLGLRRAEELSWEKSARATSRIYDEVAQ